MSQFWPKISIITPSFNQGEFLEGTILSVLQQNYPNLEYIIIDGGSCDNSVEIIKKYEKHLRFWVSEKDLGQSDAINKGFEIATGNLIAWLNSDDTYMPETLKKVAMLDWVNVDFCYGEGSWVHRNNDFICLYPTIKPNIYTLRHKCTLCQPAVFFKKTVFTQLGNLSLEYCCSFDYEYWLRAVFSKMRFRYVPLILASSRMYPQNKTLTAKKLVSLEVDRLIEQYYSKSDMNNFVSFIIKYLVNGRTYLKEKVLMEELSKKR